MGYGRDGSQCEHQTLEAGWVQRERPLQDLAVDRSTVLGNRAGDQVLWRHLGLELVDRLGHFTRLRLLGMKRGDAGATRARTYARDGPGPHDSRS